MFAIMRNRPIALFVYVKPSQHKLIINALKFIQLPPRHYPHAEKPLLNT